MDDRSKRSARQIADDYAWVALALAAVAGAVDGIGYLMLGKVFTSHMSGNTVALTIDVAAGHWREAWRHFEPIVPFFIGALFGLAATDVFLRLHVARIFTIIASFELLMIVIFLAIAHPAAQWMVVWPAAAMGIQNALLRRVGNRSVRTTFITGMLATTAHHLVAAITRSSMGDVKQAKSAATLVSMPEFGSALRYVE